MQVFVRGDLDLQLVRARDQTCRLHEFGANLFCGAGDISYTNKKYSPTMLCDGAQMAIFCIIFASCISSEPRAAHFRPAF